MKEKKEKKLADYLNAFVFFSDKPQNHEDILTRNFLILLKYVPKLRDWFFTTLHEQNNVINGNMRGSKFYTQVDGNSAIFRDLNNFNLFSILLSDDNIGSTLINSSDREARYDGVIVCEKESIVFIIENKPNSKDVWEEQLKPSINTLEKNGIIVNEVLFQIKWEDIIREIENLIQDKKIESFYKQIMIDFMIYINDNYPKLHPFDKFSICLDDDYLLNKRCKMVLAEYAKNKSLNVKYHKGWMNYVEYPNITLKKIGFEAKSNVQKDSEEEKNWYVSTPLHLANTMRGAQILYENIEIKDLENLEKQGFNIKPWLHFSFRQTGICYFRNLKVDWKDYVKFWKNELKENKIKQIGRGNFESYIQKLKDNNIVTDENDIKLFRDEIEGKKYTKVNVCPDLQVVYKWDKNVAKKLDDKDKFINDFTQKVDCVIDLIKNLENSGVK